MPRHGPRHEVAFDSTTIPHTEPGQVQHRATRMQQRVELRELTISEVARRGFHRQRPNGRPGRGDSSFAADTAELYL